MMSNSLSPTQQGSTHKQIILDNPFHPLDLSAHDLLTVYKRFEVSREANRNPKQELPIETIAQLISSLKGCKPSYVQKCMSQALIKDSISWNQFLAFLDQESQVRYKILDWLLLQKAIIKYRYQYELPFRKKIVESFDTITDLNFISLGEDRLILVSVDHKKLVLIDITDKKFQLIDQIILKNKQQQEQVSFFNESSITPKPPHIDRNFRVKLKNQLKDKINSTVNRSVVRSQKLMSASDTAMAISAFSKGNLGDDEYYLRKQRKNINALFNLFSQLPNQHSAIVAGLASERIQNRTLNSGYVGQIKESFEGFVSEKKMQTRAITRVDQKPLDQAKRKLQSLYHQKSHLTYNPYKPHKPYRPNLSLSQPTTQPQPQKKQVRSAKQKQYLMQSIHEKYCKQLNCIGMVYYNMQVNLIKVSREYNKIILEKQDTLKILSENDYKKNQIIQMLDFYYHRTTDKWFLVVLFRNQYKHQPKNHNDSFIKGYEIACEDIKFRGGKKYYFPNKREEFFIDIGKTQIIKILAQPEYGIHLISHAGKYMTWKEDYITSDRETIYWKKDLEEKFKGASLSLCYICVSSQLNKAVLGTIKGVIVIFDLFSKQYKIKKVSNQPILQIEMLQEKAYILTENQKIVLYDIVRGEEIQTLSVKNEERLNQKVDRFTIEDSKIVCYGCCIRIYEKFVDESLQQQKFKMENIYTWRLHKLDKSKGNQNPNLKVIPTFRKAKTNAELLARSENLFLILTEIQQAIFYSTSSLKVKFTTIIDIPHYEKIMRVTISPDEKLIAVLLFTQAIYVFNIYTQEQIMHLKSTPNKKYSHVSFLDRKNQYLLACGTEMGNIVLVPVTSLPEKKPKIMEFHLKNVSLVTLKDDLLVTSSQNQDIVVWQLPFNILRHEIKLNGKLSPQDYITEKLGSHQGTIFLRTVSGAVVEINVTKGELKSITTEFSQWNHMSIDVLAGYLIGSKGEGQIYVYERRADRERWSLLKKMEIDPKNQVIGIGIIETQKASIFTKNGIYVWQYRSEKISKFKSYIESII